MERLTKKEIKALKRQNKLINNQLVSTEVF